MNETHTLALEVEKVTARYSSHEVLKDVSLTVGEGEFLGIIGPNGGGKSTLLKVILGILKPDAGRVRIFGLPPERARHLIGYVPQYNRFDERFPIRVWDVVLMGRLGRIGSSPFYSRHDRKIVKDALEQVGMESFRDRQISQLSGGQQQRVFVARALAMKPRIILLDEPTASVDKKMETGIYELLQQLNDEITIILVTHDVGVLSTYVKTVGCLNKYFIYHGTKELTGEMIEAAYECPVDLIAHGVPHRVFHHEMQEGDL